MPFLYELLENCRRLVGLEAVNALEGSRIMKQLINFALPFPRIFKRWGTCTYVIGTHAARVDRRRLRSCHAHSGLRTGPREARASFHYDNEARIQSRVFFLVFFQLSWTKFCRTGQERGYTGQMVYQRKKKSFRRASFTSRKVAFTESFEAAWRRTTLRGRCLSFSWSSFCASELYT